MKILLVVSTMSGTSEMLAEDMRDSAREHDVRLALAERIEVAQLREATHVVVVSSTYGSGEVPDPAKPLFAALKADPSPLAHLHFGVVALGDCSLYAPTFANGGRQWDALLEEKGARRVSEMLVLDCSSTDDLSGPATDWFGQWLEAVAAAVD